MLRFKNRQKAAGGLSYATFLGGGAAAALMISQIMGDFTNLYDLAAEQLEYIAQGNHEMIGKTHRNTSVTTEIDKITKRTILALEDFTAKTVPADQNIPQRTAKDLVPFEKSELHQNALIKTQYRHPQELEFSSRPFK